MPVAAWACHAGHQNFFTAPLKAHHQEIRDTGQRQRKCAHLHGDLLGAFIEECRDFLDAGGAGRADEVQKAVYLYREKCQHEVGLESMLPHIACLACKT